MITRVVPMRIKRRGVEMRLVLSPLNQELARSAPKWRQAIAPIAEEVAQTLFKSASKYFNQPPSASARWSAALKDRLPTPLTGSNRSAGRPFEPAPTQPEQERKRRKPVKRASWKLDCVRCGKQIDGKHGMYCNACLH